MSNLVQYIVREKFNLKVEKVYNVIDGGTMGNIIYLLGDGICAEWVIFAKQINHPDNADEKLYTG